MAVKANKRTLWLKHYLNEDNKDTFLNKTNSSKAANYKCKNDISYATVGCENFRILEPQINQWIDDVGLSESRLKKKLIDLTEAKEIKFFAKDGIVTETREIEAIETQRRSLDMAMKVKGLYDADNKQKSVIIVAKYKDLDAEE